MEVLPCAAGVLTADEVLLVEVDKVLLPPETKCSIFHHLLNIIQAVD